MNVARFLIVYTTKNGQTQKIAEFIAEHISKLGGNYDLYDVKSIPPNLNPRDYDQVLIGAPVYASRYSSEIVKWVKKYAPVLASVRSSFFSVCMGIAENNSETAAKEREIVEDFFRRTGWLPKTWVIFAGALNFTRYNFILKMIMKHIAKAAGQNCSSNQNYEFTHWNEVQNFTDSIVHQKLD